MSQFKLVFDWSTIYCSDQRLTQVKFVYLKIILLRNERIKKLGNKKHINLILI